MEAYGDVDELNSALGLAAAATNQEDLAQLLAAVQGTLFDLGATLASPDPARREKSGHPAPHASDVAALEDWIDRFEQELEPLRRFILPGGTPTGAALHFARTVCRRAERRVVALDAEESVGDAVLGYLNRLSDLLFVLARVENRRARVPDVEWEGRSR